jgi:uncharacterized membrane protein YqjE
MINMGSNKDDEAFNSAKDALLSNYNSQQSNQTTRLLGFIGVLFSIMLLSSQIKLGIIAIDNTYRVAFQAIAIFALLTLIIFTLGRFSVFSQLSSDVIYVTRLDVETALKGGLPIHHALVNATWARVSKRRFYIIKRPIKLSIKLSWFATEGEPGKDRRWGLILSVGISIILTAFVVVIFLL